MKIILSFIFMFGVVSSALAQYSYDDMSHCSPEPAPPRIYMGFTGGYGRIFHSNGISNPINNNQIFEEARSNSFFVGLCVKYILGKRAVDGRDPTSNIFLKVYYSNLNTAKSILNTSQNAAGANGQPVFVESEYMASFKASFINTELTLFQQLPVISGFSVGAGFGVGFPLTRIMEKRFEIIQPDGMVFLTDDSRFRYEKEGRIMILEEDNISKVIYYAKAGISYYNVFPFGNRLTATPSVFYNFGLNRAVRTEDFKINSLQLGLDFTFAL